jgi:hypothetical protein
MLLDLRLMIGAIHVLFDNVWILGGVIIMLMSTHPILESQLDRKSVTL